jgi:hypothetical protein
MVARELAAGLIGDTIATLETSRTMRALHPMSTMVFKEEGKVTGVLGALPLRASGLLALATDRFDPVNPDPDQIAPAGEEPLAVYGWGFAATTRCSGRPSTPPSRASPAPQPTPAVAC